MRYLVRISRTPTGGVVLDPFAGSGTTGVACEWEDRDYILIEKSADYTEIIKARTAHARKQKALQPELFTEEKPEEKETQINLFEAEA